VTNARFRDDFSQYKLLYSHTHTHTYTRVRENLVGSVCFSDIITIGIHKRRSRRSSPARGIYEARTHSYTHSHKRRLLPCNYSYVYNNINMKKKNTEHGPKRIITIINAMYVCRRRPPLDNFRIWSSSWTRRVPSNYYYLVGRFIRVYHILWCYITYYFTLFECCIIIVIVVQPLAPRRVHGLHEP